MSESDPPLTTGICALLSEASQTEINALSSSFKVQLVSIKKEIPPVRTSATSFDKYWIVLSDGVHFVQTMLATELNILVSSGALVKNAVVVVHRFACHIVQGGRRVIVVQALHVVCTLGHTIGNPCAVLSSDAASRSATTETPDASTSTMAHLTPQPSVFSSHQAAQFATDVRQDRSTYPIEALNPYLNNWTIKARVIRKSKVTEWSNNRGKGKHFRVTFMDDTGKIEAVSFNAAAVELDEKLEENKVYYVSRARVDFHKKNNPGVQNDYEMKMDTYTVVEECVDTANFPMIRYNFIPLCSLETLQKDVICDVIGIVTEVGPIEEAVIKATNKPTVKRVIVIVDRSLCSVGMTLWRADAETFTANDLPVVAFKGVKVGDFGGRSLSVLSSSCMMISPDIEEAHLLRGWYDGVGVNECFRSLSMARSRREMRQLRDIGELQLGMSGKTDSFDVRATVMCIKPGVYPACLTKDCWKKVSETTDGWRCDKCDETRDRCAHRYRVSVKLADQSGSAWFGGFDPVGLALFGKTADEVMEIKNRDEGELRALAERSAGKVFDFHCTAKPDTRSDQTCPRYDISHMQPVEYYEEAKHLRDLINELRLADVDMGMQL